MTTNKRTALFCSFSNHFIKMRYRLLAKPFKPKKIRNLLIGEAPPPDGTTYFYRMPEKYSRPKSKIEDDTSLRATIFNHYFGRRPNDRNEYLEFLNCLKERGIFLIDILNKPIVIRKKDGSIDEDNLKILLSEENLNELDSRIKSLTNADTKIIFLLARTKYLKVLKNKFPNVSYIPWKCFRLDKSEANDCKNNNPNPISVKKIYD